MVDTHTHIMDPRFLHADGTAPAHAAAVADYNLFKRRLGLSRSIVVAPSGYGTDNRSLLDGLEQFGLATARGVALLHPDVADAELDALHAHGVRGIRLYLAKYRIPTPDETRALARRATDRGWSLQLVGNREREVFVDWVDVLKDLPCPIVIDHFGWAPQPAGVHSRTAAVIFRLLDAGHAHAKISGVYLSSRVGYPDYEDVNELAARLIEHAPERVIWGSDWPHPVAGAQKPDGAKLFDQLTIWAPDADIRRQILVDNPNRLYWAD